MNSLSIVSLSAYQPAGLSLLSDDIAQNSLSNIETGASFFTAETFENIVAALQVEPQELFNFGHFKSNDEMLAEINSMLKENPDKIAEFYRIAKAIIL